MSDMGFSINCMHKKRERRHILNLVQNASRTLAFTSGLLEDFEGRLRVRHGRLDVYSTQQQPSNTKINTTIIGLNVRRERQATTIGENGRDGVGRGDTVLGSKGSGTERLRSKGSKDREPKVGKKTLSSQRKTICTGGENEGYKGRLGPNENDTLTGFDRLVRERSLGFRT